MTDQVTAVVEDSALGRTIDEIVELQRAYFFENKGRDSERRKKLRDIIDRASLTAGV